MLLKLTLTRPGGTSTDVVANVDAQAPVGELARALIERDPQPSGSPSDGALTLRVDSRGVPQTLPADVAIGDVALRSGDVVTVVSGDGAFVESGGERTAAATLVIADGPGAGTRFRLPRGATEVGRDPGCDVTLPDPMVSKKHARINITDGIEVIDLGSANGIYVGGELVQRVNLRSGEQVVLGDTTLEIEHHYAAAAIEAGNTLQFNRSPYLDPRYEGAAFKAPEPPQRPDPQSFPFLTMAAPLLMGVVMYAFTQQLISVVFVALSPFLMLGSYLQQRMANRKNYAEAVQAYHESLERLSADLDSALATEAVARQHEHPSAPSVINAAQRRDQLLWSRRPDRVGYLEVRAGAASLPSRSTVVLPEQKKSTTELWDALQQVVDAHANVDGVPLVAELRTAGVVGVAGPGDFPVALARSFIAQVAGLHSPAEVAIAALVPAERAEAWDWLKWLPHVDGRHSPLDVDSIGVGGAGALTVASALRDLVLQRTQDAAAASSGVAAPSDVVVLVDDDVPVERSLLVELAEEGPRVGVYLLWVAGRLERLPARAEIYVAEGQLAGQAEAGIIDGGRRVVPVAVEPVTPLDMVGFARAIAPLIDAGSSVGDAGELPSRVSFLDNVGLDLAADPVAVVDRWRASDSLPADPGTAGRAVVRKRRSQPLHAFVGSASQENMSLDLRANGPHALVGGTTGAGKSEFLQSWVMGLAINHSPNRVTFLFVDYKGGSAFSECVRLPHTVGLVTDLTPHLVKRALRSLNAELRYREHVLNRKRAKDVLELELRGDPECPPSLVIVVDEFAALVSEVPEFVDGVVNVAQRGRSLGLHLILATQRPAGVIRDNLRANTNLRVALRMADEADSEDVVGSQIAAGFDPSIPGRAVVKAGPGRLTAFQSAYVGGWTTGQEPPPPLTLQEFVLGSGAVWEVPELEVEAPEEDPGPTDLHRLVDSVRAASDAVGIPVPRKPWLPDVAETYDLSRLPQSRTDRELVYAVLDDPDEQEQRPVAFYPDVDGNMAVIGTGGSGKSTFLRTLAIAAGLSIRSGPCQVYGLDFGSRGLHLLEPLPHVGSIVNGDDDERVARTLRMLRELIDERATRYAAVRAGSITEYRELAGMPDEPRMLLLVDGFPSFQQEYEIGPRSRQFDQFQSIATDGRQVGVHVVISADRSSSIPSSLGSMIQRRLTLRLASENDYVLAGVPADALAGSPPGRGFDDGFEVQVAVLGGSSNTASQAAAVQALAADMDRSIRRERAPVIGRLAEVVHLGNLPVTDVNGLPVVGIADESLESVGFFLDDPLFVIGPPKSGKTTALTTIAFAVRRANPDVRLVYVGEGRSTLTSALDFDQILLPDDAFEDALVDLVGEIKALSGSPRSMVVVMDDAPALSALPEDQRVVDVFTAASRAGQVVLADGETSEAINSSWGLMKSVRVPRHGLALVPDQYDGESIFKTPFPPITRRDYPPGRGIYVRSGRIARVQMALPDLEAT